MSQSTQPQPEAGNGSRAGAPAVRPARPDMSTVLSNLGNLLAMDRDGKLTDLQLQQLRSLISTQTRHIIFQSLLKQQPHPLNSLPPHLNPSLPWKGGGPLITPQQFKTNIATATVEARKIQTEILPMDKVKEILAVPTEERNRMLAEDLVLKNQFSTSVTWYTKGAQGFINRGGQPASSGANTPRPPPSDTATPGVASTTGAVRPPPIKAAIPPVAPVMTPPQPVPSNAPTLPENPLVAPQDVGPPRPNQLTSTAPHPAPPAPSASQPAPQAGHVAPQIPPPDTFPRPDQQQPQTQNQPPAPIPAPRPPPVPVEPEDQRRKRKLDEYLQEARPGMEYEHGVKDVVSNFIDAIIYETARSSVSLAKHRKSDRVSVKDMAFAAHEMHDVKISGFNVQLPEKQRGIPEGERRKAKSVIPKAALVSAQLAIQARGEDAQ